jgi:hypothetical protein
MKKANPNKPDADGRTSLHHAVARRDAAAVKDLLEHGADYERNDHAGYPPTAAMFDESLSFGKWIDFKMKKGFKRVYDTFTEFLHHPKCKGSLTFVNQEQLYNGIIDRSLARVKSALTEGGVWNLDIRLADGTTPLHLAARLGEARIVKELLANKANPNARDKAGKTPHDVAVANGHVKVAALFGVKNKPAKPKRVVAKTSIGKLEDKIVAEVAAAVHEAYTLEDYTDPLDSILLVGDEVSCSTLYLNVPGLRDMARIDESDGYRVEGRFITEDDAFELQSKTGLDVMEGAWRLMYRVAARVEQETGAYCVYVDHSTTRINENLRARAKKLVDKPIEEFLGLSRASSDTGAKAPRRKSARSASRRSRSD